MPWQNKSEQQPMLVNRFICGLLSMQPGVVAREAASGTALRPKPEMRHEVVTCVDGFGTPSQKIDDYRIFDNRQLIQYSGFKLFYHLEKRLTVMHHHPATPPAAQPTPPPSSLHLSITVQPSHG